MFNLLVRVLKKCWLPTLVATSVILVAYLLEISTSQRIHTLKTRVAEYFLVDADGPRLGAKPASDKIVLVLFDQKSSEKLTPFRSYEADIQLYKKLAEAQAAVVYDSRNLAIGTQETLDQTRTLIDSLFQLNQQSLSQEKAEADAPKSTLFVYDAWITPSIGETDMRKYAVFSTLNPLTLKPHKQAFLRERLFPLGYNGALGFLETPPLKIARHYWRGSLDDTNYEFARSGVMTEFHRQFPARTSPFSEESSNYKLVDKEIPWTAFEVGEGVTLPAGFEVCLAPSVAEFRWLSFVDALESTNLADLDLKGRIVIVGYHLDEDPAADVYLLPSASGKSCAAHMIALATQTILDQSWSKKPSRWIYLTCLIALCGGMFLIALGLKPYWALIAGGLLLVAYLLLAAIGYRYGWQTDFLLTPAAGLFCGACGIAIQAWQNFRAHIRIVDMFGRYVPRAVVNQLILQPELDALKLGGSKREVTVLFADIRGFTSFSEKMPPDQVVAELNSLLKIMVDCTFEYQGTLDKFIGDAILVLFNAPLNQDDHVFRAVKMALAMQSRIANHATGLSIGIGIHFGQAVVGNIGTPQRMEYTAIGSTVNIASRLCDQAQAGTVVVSQQVYDLVSNQFSASSLGNVKVKGLSETIAMWSLKTQ